MAGITRSPDLAAASTDTHLDARAIAPARARDAWLTIAVAGWFIGALYVVVFAISHGLAPDPLASVYAAPFYLGIGVSAAVVLALAIRASRRGLGWRRALPDGYGVLALGVVLLVVGLIADVGWREGIGIPNGMSEALAPSRLVVFAGLILIAVAPLRSAVRSGGAGAPRWAAVLSASFVLAFLFPIPRFHPAGNGLLERPSLGQPAEIWSMEADGRHQTRLIEAHDGVLAWNPVWSPDGEHLAYTRLVIGTHPPVDIPDEADVWIADADGSHAHGLVAGPDWQWLPHWSPDGQWIAYTNEAEGGPWAATGPTGLGGVLGTAIGFGPTNPVRTYADIWRVRADGTGSPERITDAPGDDRAAAYSPDGTQLALDSTRSGGTEIWIINADGSGTARQLTFDHGYTWGATWSPDGRRIVFNAWKPGGGNQDLFVIATDGGAEQRLTIDPAQDLTPSWSPDGSRIAFRRFDDEESGEIWSIAADGSDPQPLSRDEGVVEDLTSGGGAWGPDGRITYVRSENPPGDRDLFVRGELATTTVLIVATLVALIAVVLATTRPPFGAFLLLLGIPTTLIGLLAEQPRFIPPAIVGGLIVDVLVRFGPDRWKVALAGAGSAAAFVVAAELAVAAQAELVWPFALVAGVVVASMAIGAALAAVVSGSGGRSGDVRS